VYRPDETSNSVIDDLLRKLDTERSYRRSEETTWKQREQELMRDLSEIKLERKEILDRLQNSINADHIEMMQVGLNNKILESKRRARHLEQQRKHMDIVLADAKEAKALAEEQNRQLQARADNLENSMHSRRELETRAKRLRVINEENALCLDNLKAQLVAHRQQSSELKMQLDIMRVGEKELNMQLAALCGANNEAEMLKRKAKTLEQENLQSQQQLQQLQCQQQQAQTEFTHYFEYDGSPKKNPLPISKYGRLLLVDIGRQQQQRPISEKMMTGIADLWKTLGLGGGGGGGGGRRDDDEDISREQGTACQSKSWLSYDSSEVCVCPVKASYTSH